VAPLFDKESLTWKINREPVMFLGGGRALLIQAADQALARRIIASDYLDHPWQRLTHNLDIALKISFSEKEQAASEKAKLIGWSQDELLWAWAALLDTSLVIYQRYVGNLKEEEIEQFYREQLDFFKACGGKKTDAPKTYNQFVDYYQARLKTLQPSKEAKQVMLAVTGENYPKPLLALRPLLNLVTVGLLPAELQSAYNREIGLMQRKMLIMQSNSIKTVMRILPGLVRERPARYISR
jgi:uncharacterized protein (DUF2236 family)